MMNNYDVNYLFGNQLSLGMNLSWGKFGGTDILAYNGGDAVIYSIVIVTSSGLGIYCPH
jgi:hypothetical protein